MKTMRLFKFRGIKVFNSCHQNDSYITQHLILTTVIILSSSSQWLTYLNESDFITSSYPITQIANKVPS